MSYYVYNYIKYLFNLVWNEYLTNNYFDETSNIEYHKEIYLCPICSYNMLNTTCYESRCVNFRQKILF